jgi:hypothetical protein
MQQQNFREATTRGMAIVRHDHQGGYDDMFGEFKWMPGMEGLVQSFQCGHVDCVHNDLLRRRNIIPIPSLKKEGRKK